MLIFKNLILGVVLGSRASFFTDMGKYIGCFSRLSMEPCIFGRGRSETLIRQAQETSRETTESDLTLGRKSGEVGQTGGRDIEGDKRETRSSESLGMVESNTQG